MNTRGTDTKEIQKKRVRVKNKNYIYRRSIKAEHKKKTINSIKGEYIQEEHNRITYKTCKIGIPKKGTTMERTNTRGFHTKRTKRNIYEKKEMRN